ncbi:hypothetical protein AJ85_12245 [Alkalihalobacillus alcalophilus ATCC 27647 = CGMCC 1.3604]|uniref:Uncharacterized protein n=2 Tax=Alkalihalobacillus alcalophilus TaxID=1445 RepID=A0A4S4JY71_ALKAL|nr:hypothetical protein AJ85_12245 [Alkalihalobacillus alcalophilus ATCC 27647 = CGMCC 1.3604]
MTGTYAFDIISEGGERIMEERFNKIEDMLSQLIHMVGTMKAEQEEMKSEITGMKSEITGMKSEITGVKSEITGIKADLGTVKREQGELKDTVNILKRDNEHAHKEMLETLKSLESDQDFIWQKAVKNERDIARYVKQQD